MSIPAPRNAWRSSAASAYPVMNSTGSPGRCNRAISASSRPLMLLQMLQRLIGGRRQCAAVPCLAQRLGHRQSDRGRVLHDQHVLAIALLVIPYLAVHADRRLIAGRQQQRHLDLVDQAGLDAAAVVAHGHGNVGAIGEVGVALAPDRRGIDPDVPAFGQGIAGVDDQVEHRAFQLHRVDQGDGRQGGQLQGQGDSFTDRAGHQFLKRAHVLVDVNWTGIERLLTGKGQQPLGEHSGAVGRAQRHLGVLRHLIHTVFRHPLADQLKAGDDAGKQVVEIVGDAPGETAQGVHFLQLQQLRLGAHALGYFLGQLAVGIVQACQVRALAVTVFGNVLDEHQA
ncbi:hypothetical protein WR25_02886 [Diploscapter pachys]|uniref:Uncharacterized protein n=1 Tax=Diploscapter pachys TaxID=2018661 RepID=A0A2A2K8W6_9BILA|nr:hypothetical protein WR25_02886 [Diploscapter pachys]